MREPVHRSIQGRLRYAIVYLSKFFNPYLLCRNIIYYIRGAVNRAALRDGDDRRGKLLRLDNVIVEHDDIVHQPQEVPDRRNDVISEAVSAGAIFFASSAACRASMV